MANGGPRRTARARRARLLTLGAGSIGLLCFALAWGAQHLLIRARFYPLVALQNVVYDRGMTAHARQAALGGGAQGPVAVVQITENTRARLNRVPPFLTGFTAPMRFRKEERAFHARVVRHLRRLGAAVIVFDMVFDEEEPEIDPHLAAAIGQHGRVLLAAVDDTGVEQGGRAERTISLQPPTETLRVAAAGMGVANLPLDVDKTLRKFSWWSIGIHPETLEDTEVPALGVAAAALYRGAAPERVIQEEVKPARTFLGKRVVTVAGDERGIPMSLIRYSGVNGAPAGRDSEVEYADVFALGSDPEVDEERLRAQLAGRIVFVGDTTLAAQDIHRVPVLSPGARLEARQEMPGVEVQAHIALTALRGDYPRPAPEAAQVLLLLGTCLAVALLGRFLTPAPALALALGLGALLWWGSIRLLAVAGVWMEPVTASAGLTLSAIAAAGFMYFTERRERLEVRRQLSRHVGPGVAEKLAEHEWPDLSGESVEITLLFSDLQGFTSLSETMSSRDVCALLNRYFGDVIFPIVDRYGGSTDKLMGDGLMAYFGWPARRRDHAARAIRCALEMQTALAAWLRQPENAGLPPLRTRIGIHTGEATIGEIGSGTRAEFTVIGDVVNVASRLEGMNKEFGSLILISEDTRTAAGDLVPMMNRGRVTVRGRAEPMAVFSIDPQDAAPRPDRPLEAGPGDASAATPPAEHRSRAPSQPPAETPARRDPAGVAGDR